MPYTKGAFAKSFLILTGCALAAGSLLCPPEALAWRYSRRSYWNWDSSTARSLQSQRHSAAAEVRRESARQANRERIQGQRAQFQEDFLASQRAIRAGARAASRAPRDAFYRKPGFTRQSMLPSAVEMEVAGTTFFYDRGIFFLQMPNQYIVVPAPVGAVVDTLPDGTGAAFYNNDCDSYFYHFGTFFVPEGDAYKVVAPPPGIIVGFVPDGYTKTKADESVKYQFGSIIFEAVFLNGNVFYQVV